MKVKESTNITNKKKNALPSSKLLKPKKFKPSLKKSGEGTTILTEDTLKFIKKNVNKDTLGLGLCEGNFTAESKTSKKSKTQENSKWKVKKPLSPQKTDSANEAESEAISSLFDFTLSGKREKIAKSKKVENNVSLLDEDAEKTIEKSQLSKSGKKTPKKDNKINISKTPVSEKKNNGVILNSKTSKTPASEKRNKKQISKIDAESISVSHIKAEKSSNKKVLVKAQSNPFKDNNKVLDRNVLDKCNFDIIKVSAATKCLLKLIKESSQSKSEILDVGNPIFLQVECIKIPICPAKQLRFKLPHPLIDETSDVLLITSDLKGHKIYPDKAIEYYEELLGRNGINFVNKIMPYRMIKKEYMQFEMRRKLVDQFDTILADSRIIKSLPGVLGNFILYKRKMPIPVKLTIDENKLKKHLGDAITKTQMTVKSNGHCSVVQIGHSKMSAEEIAANIVEVGRSLEKLYPGGWINIRSIMLKTSTSISLPLYYSLLPQNEVKIPVEVCKRPKPEEGELSTMPGYNVVVLHDGNVLLKKVEEDVEIDDSKDDEILEEAKKYKESTKTVRYEESSDDDKNGKEDSDSDDAGEAITKAMEKKLLNKYEKSVKKKSKKGEDKEGEDEEEEEEEEESDGESEFAPVIGKKRKSQGAKRQSGPPTKKPFSSAPSKGKSKVDKPNQSKKASSPGQKKPQPRGSRGGKKNKLSKDQRKALIKRKKAGKK